MVHVIFVCLGNICRSPAAEADFYALVKKENLDSRIEVDSAGTNGFHDGEKADPRMIKQGLKRGLAVTSISRKFDAKKDFSKFDYILAMDDQNLRTLRELDPEKKYHQKIFKFTDFKVNRKENFVPDPYYGPEQDFELVLEIVKDCSNGLLRQIKKDRNFEASN